MFTLQPRSWLRCRIWWAVWWRLLRKPFRWQFGSQVSCLTFKLLQIGGYVFFDFFSVFSFNPGKFFVVICCTSLGFWLLALVLASLWPLAFGFWLWLHVASLGFGFWPFTSLGSWRILHIYIYIYNISCNTLHIYFM